MSGARISGHMPERYRRSARAFGLTLFRDDGFSAWDGFSLVLAARLTTKERAALTWSALRSLPENVAVDTAATVLPEPTGAPVAPLFSHLDEASFWASYAVPEALDAYALAAFSEMTPKRQTDFLSFIQEQRGRAA